MTIERLPEPLGPVTVAPFVAPSSLSLDPVCLLRRQGRDLDGQRLHGLIESPRAILGQIVHAAIELADGRSNLRQVFDDLVRARERALGDDARRSHLVPLRASCGEAAWANGHRVLQARTGTRPPYVPSDEVAEDLSAARQLADHAALHEVWLSSEALGLRGSADLVEERPDGTIRITDWKTGAVVDDSGSVKAAYRLQLAAYHLLAEERWPGRPIETYLFDGSAIAVALEARDFEAVRKSIAQLRSHSGQRTPVAAELLASPGPECSNCQLRARCPKFMALLQRDGRVATAPDTEGGRDLLGVLDSCKQQEGGLIANLRLPDGSVRQLRGLSDRFDLNGLVGETLACFGFNPLQRRSRATGEPLEPSVYLEKGPGSRAWQAEIFIVEPNGSDET